MESYSSFEFAAIQRENRYHGRNNNEIGRVQSFKIVFALSQSLLIYIPDSCKRTYSSAVVFGSPNNRSTADSLENSLFL